MGVKFAALRDRQKTVSFPFETVDGTEDIEITYKPSSVTPRLETAIRQLTGDEQMAAVTEILSTVIAGWNVEADGKPYPTEADALRDFGIDFLNAAAEAIFTDMKPGESKPAS